MHVRILAVYTQSSVLNIIRSFRVVFCGVFYGNIWESRSLPFVSKVVVCSVGPGSLLVPTAVARALL